MSMNIFVIGDARSGKSSAARFLAQALGSEMAETGDVVIEQLAKLYAVSHSHGYEAVPGHASVETWSKLIRLGKPEFRRELAAIGDMLVEVSPTSLIDVCAKRAQVIVGVRRRREVLGYFQGYGHAGWRCVWIRVVGPYAKLKDPSYELADQPCDYEVINSGDLSELQKKMFALARVIQSKAAA